LHQLHVKGLVFYIHNFYCLANL